MRPALVVFSDGRVRPTEIIDRTLRQLITNFGTFGWCDMSHRWRWVADEFVTLEVDLPSPAVLDELERLAGLREHAPTIMRFLEQLLAEQGEPANAELIKLQHALVEVARLVSAPSKPEQLNTDPK